MFRRRQRPWPEVLADPKTPYMVGRLIGASEMAAAILRKEDESENAKRVGEVLQGISNFFMEEIPE